MEKQEYWLLKHPTWWSQLCERV